jgi:FlaA1/EpsC-like NDP-sugar epimerase
MKPYPKLPSEFATDDQFFKSIVGRTPTQSISLEEINEKFGDQTILVTGAGGTIGSALARRLLQANIKQVFFLDRDESSLHALALNLSNSAASHSERCIVGDVKDLTGLHLILDSIRPDIVFHTAALKHLVMLERFPREGYLTNVLGTSNVINAGMKSAATRFVNVSTDKAANPTSILGRTKRIGELLIQETALQRQEIWSSVRFGNVFASRGSVIETFIHQISNGIPITLTDKEVTRFFMSHDEAANLILASACMEVSGIYIQQMGEPVLILDVINNLSAALGVPADIKLIGLQRGEKMHEELFGSASEQTSNHAIHRLLEGSQTDLISKISALASPATDAQAREMIDYLLPLKLSGAQDSSVL